MIELSFIELVDQIHTYNDSDGYKSDRDKQDNTQQKEVFSHTWLFPLDQILALLKEVTHNIHIVQGDSGTLLEILEFTQNILIFDVVVLMNLLQFITCFS